MATSREIPVISSAARLKEVIAPILVDREHSVRDGIQNHIAHVVSRSFRHGLALRRNHFREMQKMHQADEWRAKAAP